MSNLNQAPQSPHPNPKASWLGSLVITFLIFLALPFTQLISSLVKDKPDLVVANVNLPPPPPPPPEPPPPEEEQVEEEKPEMEKQQQKLSLSELELALDAGSGDGMAEGMALVSFSLDSGDLDDYIFDIEDLDQIPRPITQVAPKYPHELKRQGVNGRVILVFIVDDQGNVRNVRVETSTHREFEKPAVDAVEKWKFQPGERQGKKVKTRMRLPLAFNVN